MQGKTIATVLAATTMLVLLADPAMAQTPAMLLAQAEGTTMGKGLAVLGAGLAVLGAGYGIGRMAAAAAEGTARQPEAGGRIFTTMIIAAALIEGATMFAIVVALIA